MCVHMCVTESVCVCICVTRGECVCICVTEGACVCICVTEGACMCVCVTESGVHALHMCRAEDATPIIVLIIPQLTNEKNHHF